MVEMRWMALLMEMKLEIETVLLWWKALEKYLELKMEKTSLKAQLMEYDSHHMEYRSSTNYHSNIHHREPIDRDSRLF